MLRTEVGDFIHAVHEVLARNNCTEAVGKELHNVLKKSVNYSLPSYKKAVEVLRDTTNEPKQYPSCPDDCEVSAKPINYSKVAKPGYISSADLGKMKCSYCQSPFADKDLKPKKVSCYPGKRWYY